MTVETAPERLLTADEAADLLRVNKRTVHRLVERGELTFVRVGRLRRYRPETLRAYIERQEVGR